MFVRTILLPEKAENKGGLDFQVGEKAAATTTFEWTESTVVVLNATISEKMSSTLPNELMEGFVHGLSRNVEKLSKSADFSKLCLTLITRYPKQIAPFAEVMSRAVIPKINYFMSKTISSKLNAIQQQS